MTLARLFAAALVLCSLPALAQRPKLPALSEPYSGPIVFQISDSGATQTAPSEPWLVVWNQPAEFVSGQNPLVTEHLEQPRLSQTKSDPHLRLKAETLDADMTCYRIRAYLVARDSKDSDSTHPAGYSTCQPSAQYQLKTTVLRSGSQDR